MDADGYNTRALPRSVPLPSIHLHPSLSSATRYAPHADPSPRTSLPEGRDDFEITRPSPSISPARRITSRPSTASSVEENSDDDWDHPADRQTHNRHHPYQSHHSAQRRPQLSVSPSYSRRASIYSPYSQSHDDMRAFLRASASASASANASADEGSNSNSYYDGDSPVASLSTTSSPIYTFVPGSQTDAHHDHGIPNVSSSAGRPGAASAGNGGLGRGSGQSNAPLSLDSLPSYPLDQKPPFSYPVLIRLAILGSPQKRLLLSQIYSAIEDKFPWYRDSAPKAWKASVRHCLSLNKEFVRMQRAVEDPGVGCGGWWSVGEGMKGLKRPRKRRPAQSKRGEHELDPAPSIKTTPLAIRRRHSTTFEDALSADPYSRYTPPLSSSSLPPSAASLNSETHRMPGMKERGDGLVPPLEDYSLRLPPLHIPNPAHPLLTPPSSSRTVVFRHLTGGMVRDGEVKREYPHGYSVTGSYARPRGTHTPTASSSSSYSTQSHGSASSASSNCRPNPMSISSLLNDRDTTSNGIAGAVTERLDKMDIDMDGREDEAPLRSLHSDHGHDHDMKSTMRQPKTERDAEMRPAKEETPFSSDQTLRPPSPSGTSPQSQGRRSTTPVAPIHTPVDHRHYRVPQPHPHPNSHSHTQPHTQHELRSSSRPSSRSRGIPARPARLPPPVPQKSQSRKLASEISWRNAEPGVTVKASKGSMKSIGSPKPWASSMDLSVMEPESESE